MNQYTEDGNEFIQFNDAGEIDLIQTRKLTPVSSLMKTIRQRSSTQKVNDNEFHISQSKTVQEEEKKDIEIPIQQQQIVKREPSYNGIIMITILFVILFGCYFYYDKLYWH